MALLKPVGELTRAFLLRIRCSEQQLDTWTSQTSLLHDLGWTGDEVLDAFETLHKEFGVDFSNFVFENFFPSETSNEAYYIAGYELLSSSGLKKIAKFLYQRKIEQIKRKYPKVTFEMLEEVIKRRKWIY